jgi:signal transduction histidine kinase
VTPSSSEKPGRRLPAPAAWQGSLLLFGLLIGLVLVYFFIQLRHLEQTFLAHAREHARTLATVIRYNARGALLAQEGVAEVVETFLGNSARFIDYLDSVEPFSADELAEYAAETGLAGIRIFRGETDAVEGPAGWLPAAPQDCPKDPGRLVHRSKDHLFLLAWPRAEGAGCVVAGLPARPFERIQEEVGVPRLLSTLSHTAGVHYVEVRERGGGEPEDEIAFVERSGLRVAEARFPLEGNLLAVGLDTRHFLVRTRQLWMEFALFSVILALAGGLFSWLLHRLQRAHVERVRRIERELARQREDAALGRSAAAIAHEIRNPLNAIGMSLQMLGMEDDERLSADSRELIDTMRHAVKRTNAIVENLRSFARPVEPRREPVSLNRVAGHIASLYRPACQAQAIDVRLAFDGEVTVSADRRMVEQVVENLVKNAVEAQPEGGFLTLRGAVYNGTAALTVENGGFSLSPKQARRILQPYFTTKTRGAGLGLAIAVRIAEAHGGNLSVESVSGGRIRIGLRLPVSQAEKSGL